MPGYTPPAQPGEGQIFCRDGQLRPIVHGPEQRYVSPTSGKCRRLVVQSVKPKGKEVEISDASRKSSKLAVWLVTNPPKSGEELLGWIGRWIWFLLALIWPFDAASYTGLYKPYHLRYWGHLWAARSPKEYSVRMKELEGHELPTPAPITDSKTLTHALYPRQLMIYNVNSQEWSICFDKAILPHQPYIAVSYRQSDVFQRGEDEEGRAREMEQKRLFVEMIRETTLAEGFCAYWLDFEVLGSTPEEKNLDLYRMADIYRGAHFTLITLSNGADSWKSWGGRVWTLPEALLSSNLRYKVGNGPVIPVTLRQIGNFAYEHYDEETAIINAYCGRDPLERLERLTLLKSAIWRRGSASLPQKPEEKEKLEEKKAAQKSEFAYPAEKVYALMGFFEHRILPNSLETELQALARLSMANDNDRIAERMLSMLPMHIPRTACWYSDLDVYGAKLWDIEPEVQVAGVTKHGALVLDGCRAAAIRWKDFPDVAFMTKASFKRSFVGSLPYAFWEILFAGIAAIAFNPVAGGIFIFIALVLLIFSPLMVAYSNSGRILLAQPWLIGIKGVLTAEQVSEHLFGGAMGNFPRMFYTASGSPFAIPQMKEFREGDSAQASLASGAEWNEHMYTLVDTFSCTLYYFIAERPPTVCLFTGLEGGLGRFVLCSESCTINELHKETVLRMPSYISQSMLQCDWVALGGVSSEECTASDLHDH
ncbi:hypothetical protein BJ138DRAFT_86659 [Hygrophoropsis aurantiaca]|uniref:Uncharacterized protein n=1 Tax=Hygrophoropsis aurantiaca TaxID=72124 RepID=A0ACB8AQ12_9AGAM|nr:hypothetical protein BJ138DRAFT_86659 [Hygrophoropsis aurantiaca]